MKAMLCQSITDENLWLLKGDLGVVFVLVVIYVDDMALFGERAHVEALVQEIQGLWKISTPSWPDESVPMIFCGMEIWRIHQGWKITQRRYLQELLQRFQVKGLASSPMSKWIEPEPENAGPELIREAQAITGALLWAVTRTRPDLAFTVSKMSQYATKSPGQVLEWGMQALRYVSTVMDLGLEFKLHPGPWFGQEGQLALPRDGSAIEMYSDASHAVNGGRSSQCIIASWRGCLLVWEASRQPFVTLSSAEAELIAMVGALQVSESIAPVLEELLQQDLKTSLLGDNLAALTAFNQSSGSWRNRHLRMRARAGRERIEAGLLVVSHVTGTLQVADVGTKPLPVGKLLDLLAIVGVRVPNKEAGPLAAKFFNQACTTGLGVTSALLEASPAVALALAVANCLPGAQASPMGLLSTSRILVSVMFVGAEAQPGHGRGEDSLGIVLGVGLGVIVWLGLALLQLLGSWIEVEVSLDESSESQEPESESPPDSPRLRHSQATSSSDHAPVSVLAPSRPPQRSPQGGPGMGEDQEGKCVFLLVGRTDPRSNFVPAHFLRYLLSRVGGHLVLCLGVGVVEVARLREVARTFRYGVAFAYEQAQGAGEHRGGARGPEEVGGSRSVAGAPVGQEGNQGGQDAGEDEELDIDAVRHVFQEEYDDGTDLGQWGRQVYMGGDSSVGSEGFRGGACLPRGFGDLQQRT